MIKKCGLLALLFFSMFIFTSLSAHAVVVGRAGRQNVDETIMGHSVSYTFDVPMHWRAHMDVDRVVFVNDPYVAERLVFRFNPSSASLSSTIILELSIFFREQWSEESDHIMIIETDSYVFAIRPAQNNPFAFGSDRLIFNRFLREALNPSFLRSYISVPVGSDTVVRNTVSVNGVRMNAPSHTNPLRVVFVPLRETAEALGYRIGWDAATGRISISSDTFHTTLGGNTGAPQRHNVINLNGVSYVSTMFFLQVLGCNVEIDEHSNVRITR